MALPDRYPPPSPYRSAFLPPSHTSSSPRFRGPALKDVEAALRGNTQRLDSQWEDVQNHASRWKPHEDQFDDEYVTGPARTNSLPSPEKQELSIPLSSNAPFYIPRIPPTVMIHPQYQPRPDQRLDMDPAVYEYDYRGQYHPGYDPSLFSEQHIRPLYLQSPMPIYDQQARWSAPGPSDRRPSTEHSHPQPFMHGKGEQLRDRERLVPLRPPPPPPVAGMQRSYSQGRNPRGPSNNRRNPYPPNDGRGRVSSSSRYQGGKRRFEKRSGYGQRVSGH